MNESDLPEPAEETIDPWEEKFNSARSALSEFLEKQKDLPDHTPIVALVEGTVPSGLTLGQLRWVE